MCAIPKKITRHNLKNFLKYKLLYIKPLVQLAPVSPSNLIDLTRHSKRVHNIERARSSRNHDLYSQLNFDIDPYMFQKHSLKHVTLLFKARGGLLPLNANPFIRSFTSTCTLCNLNSLEDTFHVIGLCPIYGSLRLQFFDKLQ